MTTEKKPMPLIVLSPSGRRYAVWSDIRQCYVGPVVKEAVRRVLARETPGRTGHLCQVLKGGRPKLYTVDELLVCFGEVAEKIVVVEGSKIEFDLDTLTLKVGESRCKT